MTYKTREEWLTALVEGLRIDFDVAGLTIPDLRIACSWPNKGVRKVIGQCTSTKAAADEKHQIAVSPLIEAPAEVAETVVHELIHACLPDGTGHKALFKKAMKALGLEGKATATHAGEELKVRLNNICEGLGVYPHAALSLADVKKQTTRMIKMTCEECGYVARTTAKWIDVGLPTCVCGGAFTVEEK